MFMWTNPSQDDVSSSATASVVFVSRIKKWISTKLGRCDIGQERTSKMLDLVKRMDPISFLSLSLTLQHQYRNHKGKLIDLVGRIQKCCLD